MSFDTKNYESKMKKTVEVLESEFGTIRVGRASTARPPALTAWLPSRLPMQKR